VEADKQAPEKPTTKGDYALMVKKNLRRLNANDASAKDVLEKMGRKAKIDALVTIPETEKISVSFKKLTIEDAAARLSRNTRCRRIQEEAISRSAIFIYSGVSQGRRVTGGKQKSQTRGSRSRLGSGIRSDAAANEAALGTFG
jgi:hypothetical protein